MHRDGRLRVDCAHAVESILSGVFVNERFANKPDLIRFAGWWGHDEGERFKMEKGFKPMQGADG